MSLMNDKNAEFIRNLEAANAESKGRNQAIVNHLAKVKAMNQDQLAAHIAKLEAPNANRDAAIRRMVKEVLK